jgi:hypothetical protein
LATKLKRYVNSAVVALVLWAAVVVASPAPAQAQAASTDGARGADASPERVVVHPGDSLWSVSRRLLPANATPQQIYNETARIYALNRDRIGGNPNLIHSGEVLLLAPARERAPDPAAAGRSKRGAGPAPSEGAPKKTAAAEQHSRETAQRTSRDVSRNAARAPSGAPTHQPPPELARAPMPKPVAELAPKAASNNDRWLPQHSLLVPAAVGTAIGWGVMCLALAGALLVGRKLSTKRVTRQKHKHWEMPTEYRPNGWHQGCPEPPPPAPDPSLSTPRRPVQDLPRPLRTPPRTPKACAKKGGEY